MIIISHRGNINGPDPIKENTIDQIDLAYDLGYQVEIDIWFINDTWYLGHDKPETQIKFKWIKKRRKWLWCHAKNLEAIYELNKNKMHCFWHENDKMTITNRGIYWCYPGVYIKNGITVIKGQDFCFQHINIKGICTDYPLLFDEFL